MKERSLDYARDDEGCHSDHGPMSFRPKWRNHSSPEGVLLKTGHALSGRRDPSTTLGMTRDVIPTEVEESLVSGGNALKTRRAFP